MAVFLLFFFQKPKLYLDYGSIKRICKKQREW